MWKSYHNGNYQVLLNTSTGTKIRHNQTGAFDPEFAECVDVNITTVCDNNCPFCYANCSENGKHADLCSPYIRDVLIPSLHPYTELAINGNDLTHPKLESFLIELKERDVIVNMTVHSRHFLKYEKLLRQWKDNDWIHGLGVSVSEDLSAGELRRIIRFPNSVIHAVAGIIDPSFLLKMCNLSAKSGGGWILILGYKDRGRGTQYMMEPKYNSEVLQKIDETRHILPNLLAIDNVVLSFDNLALSQLNVKDNISKEKWDTIFMGEDGQYTFYLDLVKGTFSSSSISHVHRKIQDRNIDEMFQIVSNFSRNR